MDLRGIISIAGMSGLYKTVVQIKNGMIVESLVDHKRIPAYSSQKISSLEDITVFSTGETLTLKDVFKKIFDKEKGPAKIDLKKGDVELKKYFSEVVPEHDPEKVYVSDMKKIINWYAILEKEGLLIPKKEEKTEEGTDKPKIKASGEEKAKGFSKAKPKNTAKLTKTNVPKVKVKTTRKTGVA